MNNLIHIGEIMDKKIFYYDPHINDGLFIFFFILCFLALSAIIFFNIRFINSVTRLLPFIIAFSTYYHYLFQNKNTTSSWKKRGYVIAIILWLTLFIMSFYYHEVNEIIDTKHINIFLFGSLLIIEMIRFKQSRNNLIYLEIYEEKMLFHNSTVTEVKLKDIQDICFSNGSDTYADLKIKDRNDLLTVYFQKVKADQKKELKLYLRELQAKINKK